MKEEKKFHQEKIRHHQEDAWREKMSLSGTFHAWQLKLSLAKKAQKDSSGKQTLLSDPRINGWSVKVFDAEEFSYFSLISI